MYTHGHHETVLRSHRWRTAANSAAYLLAHLRPGMSLLDVGCGPATITADLAGLVGPGPVTATEISEEVLRLARPRHDHIEFVVADVHDLPFPDGSFDVVHAHQVLQHVADPIQALREMRRVCRPGGIVAARDSDYGAFFWYPQTPELDDWLALYRRLARRNGGQPDAGRMLLSWARAAGFTDVTASSTVWCFAAADERAFWGGMWADRVTSSSLADQAKRSGLATGAGLQCLAEGWRGWAKQPDGWFAVPHGEILCRARS